MASLNDIKIEAEDLGQLNIDPEADLAMVIGQPHFEVTSAGPIKVAQHYRQRNLNVIKQAFEIRRDEMPQRGAVPIIIFPEFTIPVDGPRTLDLVNHEIAQAEGDLVFISGMEWMTPNDIEGLAQVYNTEYPETAAGDFVNSCVIAVKHPPNPVRWYFQAKLFPSPEEQNRNLRGGKSVYYFYTSHLGFICQICFDLIAEEGNQIFAPILMRKIGASDAPTTSLKRMDYIFVPQYNPNPNHHSFNRCTYEMLAPGYHGVHNESAVLLAINAAAHSQGDDTFGCSGFHYRDRWYVSRKDSPNGYGLRQTERDVTTAVFRKRTAAIHIATLVPPLSNAGQSGNPRSPLTSPRSYIPDAEGTVCDAPECHERPIGTAARRYLSCGALPCCLRSHLRGNLPDTDSRGRWEAVDKNFQRSLREAYGQLRYRVFALPRAKAEGIMDLLFFTRPERKGNPDTWGADHLEALKEWVAALSVLETKEELLLAPSLHLTARLGGNLHFAIVDGAQEQYMKAANKYHERFAGELNDTSSREGFLVLAVLRSRGLTSLLSEIDITEHRTADLDKPPGEKSAVSPRKGTFVTCSQAFFERALGSSTPQRELDEQLGRINGNGQA